MYQFYEVEFYKFYLQVFCDYLLNLIATVYFSYTIQVTQYVVYILYTVYSTVYITE